mgnify:CR=1 FL=1
MADRVYLAATRLDENPQSFVMLGGAGLSAALALVEEDGGCAGFMGEGVAGDAASLVEPVFGYGAIAACPAVWAIGAAASSDGMEETGRDLTDGLLLSYGLVGTLKLCIPRERPDGSDSMSFPSAHSAAAAAIAAVLWQRHGAPAGAPAALAAAWTALSRVHTGRHRPSEVVAGLAIGAACGLAAAEGDGGSGECPLRGFAVGIVLDGDGWGVTLR